MIRSLTFVKIEMFNSVVDVRNIFLKVGLIAG